MIAHIKVEHMNKDTVLRLSGFETPFQVVGTNKRDRTEF